MIYLSSSLTLAGKKVIHLVMAHNVEPYGGCDDEKAFGKRAK